MPTPRLKHVYSAITLATNDLRTIAALAQHLGPTSIRANAYVLGDMDEVHQVLAEDVVVDRIAIQSESSDGGTLTFTFQSGYVLVEISDPLPDLQSAFTAITELLAAKPGNGLAQCVIETSATGTWRAPKLWARMPKQARPAAPTVTLVGSHPARQAASPPAGATAISARTRASRGWLQRLRDRFTPPS